MKTVQDLILHYRDAINRGAFGVGASAQLELASALRKNGAVYGPTDGKSETTVWFNDHGRPRFYNAKAADMVDLEEAKA